MALIFSAAWLSGCRCGGAGGTRGNGIQEVEISLDPASKGQVLEGFGTSINAWSEPLRGYYDRPQFRALYLEELGATVLRVDLCGEAVPEREQWSAIAYRDFVLDGPGERAATYLRAAEELTRASGGKLRVIASVWSPPAWMKVNGSKGNGHPERKNFALSDRDLGVADGTKAGSKPEPDEPTRQRYLLSNKLRRDRYEHFAQSLVEWVRLYRAHGVELYALSPQNEPRFSHWFGSAVYTPSELRDVLEAIVQAFAREGENLPRLFAPETMMQDDAGNRAYLQALFGPGGVGAHLRALAVHGYVDGYKTDRDPRSPGRFFELASGYGKPLWVTEGGTGDHDWPAALDGVGAALMNALGPGHATLVAPWQVVEVEPNEHGLLPISGPTKKTAVAAQFFRSFRPGMRRIRATSSDPEVQVLAMVEESGPSEPRRGALVLISRSGRALRVRVRSARGQIEVVQAEVTDREHSRAALAIDASATLSAPSSSVVSAHFAVTTLPAAP